MSNLLPAYSTKLFTDIYESATDFATDYNGLGVPTTISSTNVTTLYYLLYARYGNSPIANNDENQFKFKLFTTIWQYGPVWEKKLDIQTILRGLTEDQLRAGATDILTNTGTVGISGTDTYNNLKTAVTGKDVTNHAYNPESAPSVDTDTELTYINEQNVVKHGTDNTTSGSVSNSNTQTNNLTNTNANTKARLDAYSQL